MSEWMLIVLADSTTSNLNTGERPRACLPLLEDSPRRVLSECFSRKSDTKGGP